MDLQTRKKIAFELQCLSDDAEVPAYVDDLRKRIEMTPTEQQEISACLQKKDQAARCLQDFLRPSTDGELSETVLEHCRALRSNYEDVRSLKGSSHDLLARAPIAIFNNLFFERYRPQELSATRRVLGYYLHRTSPSGVEALRVRLLRLYPDTNNLPLYGVRKERPQPLKPIGCANQAEWEVSYLALDGVAFSIPMFGKKDDDIPWWYYQEAMKAWMEVVKTHLAPQDFEKILHQEGQPDLTIYLGSSGEPDASILKRCGMSKSAAGDYQIAVNTIRSSVGYLSPLYFDSTQGLPFILTHGAASTFYHEFGHAIDARLFDDVIRHAVRILYHWTKDQVGSKPENFRMAPMPNHVVKGLPYSLNSPEDFFADWVDEYFTTKLSPDAPQDAPMDPYKTARMRIMDDFFRKGGVNHGAFSATNLERRYAENKIEVNVRSRFLYLPAALDFQYGKFPHPDVADKRLLVGGRLGAGMVSLAPSGTMVWGGGVSYGRWRDLFVKDHTDGSQTLYDTTVQEIGAWGLLGAHYTKLDLLARGGVGFQWVETSAQKLPLGERSFTDIGSHSEKNVVFRSEAGFMYRTSVHLGAFLGGRVDEHGRRGLDGRLVLDLTSMFRSF